VEVALDRRERDVDDRGVEEGKEGAKAATSSTAVGEGWRRLVSAVGGLPNRRRLPAETVSVPTPRPEMRLSLVRWAVCCE
jgi:hypothetical protein